MGCWLLQPDRQLAGFQDCVTVLLPGSRRKDWGNRETVTQVSQNLHKHKVIKL